jgi:hypothetical protein
MTHNTVCSLCLQVNDRKFIEDNDYCKPHNENLSYSPNIIRVIKGIYLFPGP